MRKILSLVSVSLLFVTLIMSEWSKADLIVIDMQSYFFDTFDDPKEVQEILKNVKEKVLEAKIKGDHIIFVEYEVENHKGNPDELKTHKVLIEDLAGYQNVTFI